jgi:amino-acid N-acetyltransferase
MKGMPPVSDELSYVKWFRNAAPYINNHKGKTFVLMFGGDALHDPNFPNIVHDIVLLQSLGVKLVLIHGARPQIEERLALRGVTSRFHKNVRLTDNDVIQAVKDATGSIRSDIEAMFSTGIANSPMHGARIKICGGNFVSAKPMGIIDGVDHERTGEVRKVHGDSIKQLLNDGNIVLLSPIGYSGTGEVFNLHVEDLAVSTAVALKADKLVVLSSQDGLHDENGQLVRQCNLAQAKSCIAEQRLRHAVVGACEAGVPRSHIISYSDDGALLRELFTREGCGTLVSQDPYESLRPAKLDDIPGILALLQPLEEQGVLVKRSRELLEHDVHKFFVIELDGLIIGCAALYSYDSTEQAELACITVHPDYREGSRGERLLEHIEALAKREGFSRLFVLTTRTAHWFQERGFCAEDLINLPQQKQALYNYQRNSKAFVKYI